ncbi:MAG: hypothetical protein IH948_09025, partial [Bacteroidetes bacterium]|nr:hypothetical protein [Bacteroidota bacterium]
MRILIPGGSGFIGHSIFGALTSEHEVLLASRTRVSNAPNWTQIDFSEEINWDSKLKG